MFCRVAVSFCLILLALGGATRRLALGADIELEARPPATNVALAHESAYLPVLRSPSRIFASEKPVPLVFEPASETLFIARQRGALPPRPAFSVTLTGEVQPIPDTEQPDDAPVPSIAVCEISLQNDARDLGPMLHDDFLSLLTWKNAAIIGVATGGTLAIRPSLDGQVRDNTAQHPNRWGEGDDFLRAIGDWEYQVPVIYGLYGYSVWKQDDELHEFSKSLASAHAFTTVATLLLKGITNTHRPTDSYMNGHYGFPSYHTASTFAIAATVEEYYGWKAGLPAYAVAGLVGWSRIDNREHDLSDVVFGAALGYVIGKSISAMHISVDSPVQLSPYIDPRQGVGGIAIETRF